MIVDYFYFPVRAGFVTNLVRSFVRLMIWAMGLTWVFFSHKVAPVGVEKPAYAGVFLAAHGVFLIAVVQQST